MTKLGLFRLALILVLLLAAGCGHEFVRPAPGALVVGQSHYGDMLRLLGEPTYRNDNVTINGVSIKTADYYAYRFPKTVQASSPHRYLHCSFFSDVLVGAEYNSSYQQDSTWFDQEKARGLAVGKSSRQDVIAALGPPSGEIIYPLVRDKEGRGLVYWYTEYRNLSELRAADLYAADAHRLIVFLDGKGIVTDLSYKGRDGREQYPRHVTSRLSEQQSSLSPITY